MLLDDSIGLMTDFIDSIGYWRHYGVLRQDILIL